MEFSIIRFGSRTFFALGIFGLSLFSFVAPRTSLADFQSQIKSLELFWSPDLSGNQGTFENENNPGVQELQLIHVTSDAMEGALDIKAILSNDRHLLGLSYLSDKGKRLSYNLDEISQGADLMKDESRSIVKVVGHQLSSGSGGSLELVYLENGLTESYGSFNMTLNQTGENWEMRVPASGGGHKFTRMFLKGRRFFGKVIGIGDVNVD